MAFFSLSLDGFSLARLAEFLVFFDDYLVPVALELATGCEISNLYSPVIVFEFRLFKLELYCLCNFWFYPPAFDLPSD